MRVVPAFDNSKIAIRASTCGGFLETLTREMRSEQRSFSRCQSDLARASVIVPNGRELRVTAP
jgi:hypothetical protein